MTVTDLSDALPGGASLLRNEPVQARSSARLTALLDAAAELVDDVGDERLTTAMVAERAGASIGTVYRYFPDRLAVVDSLALRCLRRLGERVAAALAEGGDASPVDVLVDALVDLHRTEPGARVLRGDRLEVGGEGDGPIGATLAEQLAGAVAARTGRDVDDLATASGVAVVTALAVVSHAVRDGAVDEDVVDDGRRLLRTHLGV